MKTIERPFRVAFLLTAIVGGIATSKLGAENNACSTRTTAGRYVVKCDGYLSGDQFPIASRKRASRGHYWHDHLPSDRQRKPGS